MATIKEIAKACGVSVATVSNILNKKPGGSDKKSCVKNCKRNELYAKLCGKKS